MAYLSERRCCELCGSGVRNMRLEFSGKPCSDPWHDEVQDGTTSTAVAPIGDTSGRNAAEVPNCDSRERPTPDSMIDLVDRITPENRHREVPWDYEAGCPDPYSGRVREEKWLLAVLKYGPQITYVGNPSQFVDAVIFNLLQGQVAKLAPFLRHASDCLDREWRSGDEKTCDCGLAVALGTMRLYA